MSNLPFSTQTLLKSHELASAVAPICRVVSSRDKGLGDQLRRATQSVVLNLAEAQGHRAGNRRLRLETALGSAYEVRSALWLAQCWKYVSEKRIQQALGLVDEVAAMTFRRLRPQR